MIVLWKQHGGHGFTATAYESSNAYDPFEAPAMRRIYAVLSMIIACSSLPAQATLPDSAAASTLARVWGSSPENSRRFLNDGQTVEVLVQDNVTVAAMIERAKGHIRVQIGVVNRSGSPVDVVPDSFQLEAVTPRHRLLKYNDPDRVASSSRWGAIIGAAVGQALANAANPEVTLTTPSNGSPGSVATTTVLTDTAARRQAAASAEQTRASGEQHGGAIQGGALRANTVFPRGGIAGWVYFDDGRADSVILSVKVGGRMYQYPFDIP